jgi:2-hydroxy-6-oxonona-2,4-dienedioate hydrolase
VLLAVLTAAIATTALICFRYRADLDQARKRVARGSQIANAAEGPVEYAETGAGFPLL